MLFLSWDSPWPATWGGAVRTLGLLEQLSRRFEVEMLVLTRAPLTREQQEVLGRHAAKVTRLPLRGATRADQARIFCRSLLHGRPYHCSVVEASLEASPAVLERVLTFPGVVYASYAHWATLVHRRPAPNWVVDQQHAAVDFWRVYAAQTSNPLLKLAASLNRRLAARHFRDVYPGVGRIVTVCEDDRQLTLPLAAGAPVDVIENGIDCSFFTPDRTAAAGSGPVLFVGTDEPRNVLALKSFVERILPRIRRMRPGVRVTVGGAIGAAVQQQFRGEADLTFTGEVEDLRPVFNRSSVFVVPHADAHGSQLKVAVAMAMGMPIVSTVDGIRGLPLVPGESVLTASDDESFAGSVAALLADAGQRERLGAAARRAAVGHLDWHVLSERLVPIVERVAARAPNGAPAGAGRAAAGTGW